MPILWGGLGQSGGPLGGVRLKIEFGTASEKGLGSLGDWIARQGGARSLSKNKAAECRLMGICSAQNTPIAAFIPPQREVRP